MELMSSDSENSQGSGGNTQPGTRLYMRLVRRMTRFVTKVPFEKTLTALGKTFVDMKYSYKKITNGQFVITINDKKRQPLIFKASVNEMAKEQVLVDFRLSKVGFFFCCGFCDYSNY